MGGFPRGGSSPLRRISAGSVGRRSIAGASGSFMRVHASKNCVAPTCMTRLYSRHEDRDLLTGHDLRPGRASGAAPRCLAQRVFRASGRAMARRPRRAEHDEAINQAIGETDRRAPSQALRQQRCPPASRAGDPARRPVLSGPGPSGRFGTRAPASGCDCERRPMQRIGPSDRDRRRGYLRDQSRGSTGNVLLPATRQASRATPSST